MSQATIAVDAAKAVAPALRSGLRDASRAISRLSDTQAPTLSRDALVLGKSAARPVDTALAAGAGKAPAGGFQQLFDTIQGVVKSLLPTEVGREGIPHQRFMFQESAPEAGKLLEVDNDIKFGTAVPGLQVGEPLTIRGQLWSDPSGEQGIHWTHHYQAPGDGGFIQTPDGKIYQ